MSALAKLKAISARATMGGEVLTKLTEPGFVGFVGAPTPTIARHATEDEATELRRLLEIILSDCPDEIEWSLGIAIRDPDGALESFRALVADIEDRKRWGRADLIKEQSTSGI